MLYPKPHNLALEGVAATYCWPVMRIHTKMWVTYPQSAITWPFQITPH